MPPLSHLNALVIGTTGDGIDRDWNSSGIMLYCYIIRRFAGIGMTHHHHGPGAHPSLALAPSLLRLSALQRLSIAGFLIALIWAAAFWATN
jgi:hypothetical protein